ncbi:MAG: VOC family protein [Pseudomonadota bacterium]
MADHQSFTSYLTVKDPREAIAFYEKSLPNAKATMIMDGPGGSVMHAEMEINGATLMISGEWPGMAEAHEGISPVNFMLYVDNADDAYKHAIDNGMTSVFEPSDQFWGDRNAAARDPYGFRWTFAHKVEDVAPEEMSKRAADFAKQMAEQG